MLATAQSPVAQSPVVQSLTDLAAGILSTAGGVLPSDLDAVVAGLHRVPASPGLGSSGLASSGLGSSGLGMSAVNFFTPSPARDEQPELFCPGPLRNDTALGDEVDERVLDWAREVGIYSGRLDKLRMCGFGRFMMLAHPATSDPDRLVAATKCLVAEWAADDYYVDEVALGADPMTVGSRLANLYAHVDPAQLPRRYAGDLNRHHELEPISVAFRSAMEHLSRYASITQMARFQHQMAILFLAWCQEADWHANGRTPEVWEYLVQRHLNSYLPPMILIDVLAGYELPAAEFYHPRVREAFTTAGNAAVLVNDLYSGAQESESDFNLPTVLVADERITRREAILRTVDIHNELMHRYVELASGLSATGSPALRRFLADTWAWMGGSREWHATSGRYHEDNAREK